jgi:demethylmenaquinone methyltransferase/2-methoxy-6-polyprenyl-1,4-benzoquinol methylase
VSPPPVAAYSFEDGAPIYDRASGLIAFGTGAWYRRWSLSRAGLRPGMTVLDVGTGTGAIARQAVRLVGRSGSVVGVDPSRAMLGQVGRVTGLTLMQGVAEALPFRDAAFDFLSLGYVLRYAADVRGALRECHRVLRPDGTLLILDLAVPRGRVGRGLVRLYLERFIPWLAQRVVGSPDGRALMRYCWATVDRSALPEAVRRAIEDSGFTLRRRTVWFGFLSEHVAVKRAAPRP